MKRRQFIKTGALVSSGILFSPQLTSSCTAQSISSKSKVVIAKNSNLILEPHSVDSDNVIKVLNNGMQEFFDVDNPVEAWKQIVKSGEIIGLKVNCLSGLGSTHNELIDAIIEALREAGIKENDIVIWDRQNSDLEDGKFKIRERGNGVKCIGNEVLGFEDDFESFGQSASLVCKTLTRLCDGIINLPVLRDHGIAGVTIAMKNMFGAIHNPNKFHLNIGNPYIANVYSYPSIKNKIRLTICDAITAQYEGGPSYMPQWRWNYGGLIISNDPVALDYTGWQIIEKERKKRELKPLKEIGREPTYIATAANAKHRLGTNNPQNIDVVQV